MTVMYSYGARVRDGLKSVALWWFISSVTAALIGALYIGKEAAIVNIAGTSIFAAFIAIGVFVGAKGPAEATTINLGSPKIPTSPPSSAKPAVVSTSTLRPYSAFIESRNRHGTVVIVGKTKESAKRQIIEMFPDCKILYFDDWLRDKNYIIRGKLDD